MRTGEYRICPRCQARNKATEPRCVQCGRDLFGTLVSRSDPLAADAQPDARGAVSSTRWLTVAGVVLAVAFGLFVRKTFRGADLESQAMAQERALLEPVPQTVSADAAPAEPAPSARDFEKGRALLERGDASGALRALTPAAQAEPDNAVIAHTYGRALWATGSRDRAIMQFERAARIDPHTPAYRVALGKALAASRRTREAIREYEAAVSLDPGDTEALVTLANLYAKNGDAAESRALLDRAAALRPGDTALAQRIAGAEAGATSYTPSSPSAPSAPSAISTSSGLSSPSAPRSQSSAIVYTDEDLRRAGTGRTPGAVAPQPPPPVVRADEGQGLGEQESRWRDKAEDRREALRSAEQLVSVRRAEVARLERAAAEGRSADVERDLTRALEDLDSARERLAKAQRQWEELADEARRKSIPSSWLR